MLGMTAARIGELGLVHNEGIVRISQQALGQIDVRLMEHGDRVAFIASEMLRHGFPNCACDRLLLFQLAIFHDIGAYKIDEISRMLSLDSTEAMEHSLYGYLFLRYLSPLGEGAEAVLYHHTPYTERGTQDDRAWLFAQIIHVADTVDLMMLGGKYSAEKLQDTTGLDPQLVELFLEVNRKQGVVNKLSDGSYRKVAERMLLELCESVDTVVAYLSMLVYVIDFKSVATVDHTINAVVYAVQLGDLMGCNERERYCLYLGALMHDIGKIAIPYEIIENPGKLTTGQMEIMKTHVVITNEILLGNVTDEIRRIASRHHEKPDGSGYPWGLQEDEVSLPEKIMAVADVMSALLGRRSYKESFDIERSKGIIDRMAATGKLDARICEVALENFEQMVEIAAEYCAPVIVAYHNVIEDYNRMTKTDG